jgi:hypothetical protein
MVCSLGCGCHCLRYESLRVCYLEYRRCQVWCASRQAIPCCFCTLGACINPMHSHHQALVARFTNHRGCMPCFCVLATLHVAAASPLFSYSLGVCPPITALRTCCVSHTFWLLGGASACERSRAFSGLHALYHFRIFRYALTPRSRPSVLPQATAAWPVAAAAAP